MERFISYMIVSLVLMISCIAVGVITGNRYYYMVSIALMIVSMILLVKSTGRKLKVREIVLIASLIAIAVIGRTAFYWLPQFKPVTAIVIIAGITLGAESGMLVGMLSAFVSNFIFSQGPWTPFQMFAWGLIGLISGYAFYNKKISKYKLMIFGFLITFILYGAILNFSSALMYSSSLSLKIILSYIVSGVPFDLVHAVSTAVFLYIITNPMVSKIERLKIKYNLLKN